jgi:hypothetical protein
VVAELELAARLEVVGVLGLADAVGGSTFAVSLFGEPDDVVVVAAAADGAVAVVELPDRPTLLPEPSARAVPDPSATNRAEMAARRIQPFTALRYDKATPSLSFRLRG